MTHTELEKTYTDAGFDGDLLDDIAYQGSIADLIDDWQVRIEQIQRYIGHAKQFEGEVLNS